MRGREICAVVITFGPTAAVLENLVKVRPQVGGLVVVDNGSSADLLERFHRSAHDMQFTLIENGTNLGIAAALNIGIRWAKAQGYQYVALFDQDSAVTENFIEAMLAEYATHPLRDKVAVVTPSQVERSTGRSRTHRFARDGGPLVAITSGSLMPIEIFGRCGWFEEELIIDCVDHEFCLRARSLGYTIAECRRAVLIVAVGSASTHHVLGMTISTRHYSARRRYYMTRNRMLMIRRFWRVQPAWCCRTLQDMLQDTIKVTLIEKESWSKMRNTVRGLYDAALGRMGMLVKL